MRRMKSYDLTLAAEEDLRGVWEYSRETWGIDQADRYLDQIEACCEAIGNDTASGFIVASIITSSGSSAPGLSFSPSSMSGWTW